MTIPKHIIEAVAEAIYNENPHYVLYSYTGEYNDTPMPYKEAKEAGECEALTAYEQAKAALEAIGYDKQLEALKGAEKYIGDRKGDFELYVRIRKALPPQGGDDGI